MFMVPRPLRSLPSLWPQRPSSARPQHPLSSVWALACLCVFVLLGPWTKCSLPIVEVGRKNSISTETGKPAHTKCLDIQLDNETNHRRTPSPDETDSCLLYYPPSDYMEMLMNFVVGTPLQGACAGGACTGRVPYNEELRKYGNDWPPFGYTMVGRVRLENFRAAIAEVDRNGIDGAIVETGVWRGGAMIMAAAIAKETGSERDLYLYDAFESLPGYKESRSYLENSQEEVESHFDHFGLRDRRRVHFVKGLFRDTVPLWEKGTPIAVLRVDGNFYDSYSDVLYHMYESVPAGGIVIFDDVMTHKAVMRAWLDFKKDQGLKEELVRIDTHSAWFRKRHEIDVNQSKKHPPQDVDKSQ